MGKEEMKEGKEGEEKKDRVDRISVKMGRNKTKPKTGSEENKRMKITDKTNKIEKE